MACATCNRAVLITACGAGLHVGEIAQLQTSAIDSGRMLIRIECGKGGRDRYVMLSPQLFMTPDGTRWVSSETPVSENGCAPPNPHWQPV